MRKRDRRIITEKEVIGNGKRKAKDPPNSVKYEKYGWFDTFFFFQTETVGKSGSRYLCLSIFFHFQGWHWGYDGDQQSRNGRKFGMG